MSGKGDSLPWKMGLGANIEEGGVRFRVWAPRVSSLAVRLAGGAEPVPMSPEEKGYFSVFVPGAGAGTRYFYLLENERERPDPASRFQPKGVHGPSEIVDPGEFYWEDRDWPGMDLEEMIFYEVHTGAFTPQGTFTALIPVLDYLKDELGVTALELMPVAQFPGARNWGYDGAYLFAPQNSYGGPPGLKALVNACHRKGLAVFLDAVYNHLGPEGNYLAEYGNYFTDRYCTPWGSAINFDGPGSDEVRRFFIDNALYWITEYHFDGLRLDAIDQIFDFSAWHVLCELQSAVHEQAKKLGRRVAVVAETDWNDPRLLNPPARGGYGVDAQWNDDFHHCLHTLLTGEKTGYYQDFGELRQMAKSFREGYAYSGQYSAFRDRRRGAPSGHLSTAKFIVFSQNHDQVGNRMKGERLSALVPFEALKLAAGAVLFAPYIPLLFMGEEYGEEAPFLYFVDHGDPGLVEAVRRGRREEFKAFLWNGEVPDAAAEETFLRSRPHPELRKGGRHRVLFDFYRRLIRLRKEIPSLAHLRGAQKAVYESDAERLIWVVRRYGDDAAVVVFSFHTQEIAFPLPFPAGSWEKVLDSSAAEWGGPGGEGLEGVTAGAAAPFLRLRPLSFLLYRRTAPPRG